MKSLEIHSFSDEFSGKRCEKIHLQLLNPLQPGVTFLKAILGCNGLILEMKFGYDQE